MLIAQKKRAEHIIEFLIYMYNVEDIVRKFGLDENSIVENYVKQIIPNPSFEVQYIEWYTNICQQLKNSGKHSAGHLYEVEEVIMELRYLHQTLLTITLDQKYISLFEAASEYIEEFKSKSKLLDVHPIEVAVYAMNMKLQLKMRGQEISAETETAFDSMRILLAYLGRAYQNMKSGNLGFSEN